MDEILPRAEKRRGRALDVIETLGLLERWGRFGTPVIVGSVRHGLVVALDIDIHIYTPEPRIDQGFEVMAELALLPGVWEIRFINQLETPDHCLYWRIRYPDEEGETWKVDSYSFGPVHPDARWVERFGDVLERVLTDETRRAILEIKEAMQGEDGVRGIDVYRAVLEGRVRGPGEFGDWLAAHEPSEIVYWVPSA